MLENESGPPRINLAMFRQTAHVSSTKLGLLMTLNLTGWHLQVRRCVWNRILLIVRNENWKNRKKSSRTNTHPIYFFLRQQSFSFFPARVATRKIDFGGGCTSTGPSDCNDTKSNWVAFTSKKMRLEQNLFDCVQWELKTHLKLSRINKHAIHFFLRQQSLSLFPAWVATRKINLGVGVLVWGPMVWIRRDCLNFLHAYGLGWPHWGPYVPETLDTFTPTSNNLAN